MGGLIALAGQVGLCEGGVGGGLELYVRTSISWGRRHQKERGHASILSINVGITLAISQAPVVPIRRVSLKPQSAFLPQVCSARGGGTRTGMSDRINTSLSE